jgi:hypothetical protein
MSRLVVVLMVLLTGCGGSAWKQAALPSPVMVGNESPVTCLVQATQVFRSVSAVDPATKAADFCLQTRDREADRTEVAVVATSEAEQAEASRPSHYSNFGGYGAYGTMPVMRNGVLYSSGGEYNTVGGMVVQTGPSQRPSSGPSRLYKAPPQRRP